MELLVFDNKFVLLFNSLRKLFTFGVGGATAFVKNKSTGLTDVNTTGLRSGLKSFINDKL